MPRPHLLSFYSHPGSTSTHAARVSLAVAALLLAAACGNSPEVVAPESTLKSGGWIGSGNSIAPTPTTERGGAGLIGSGNSATPDSAFTAERGGLGMSGPGN